MQKEGFSESIIDRFFKPFLGGIFFSRDLSVTSRLFEFVMRCLATGSNCLPAQGIGAVAEQLASGLPRDSIQLGMAVALPNPAYTYCSFALSEYEDFRLEIRYQQGYLIASCLNNATNCDCVASKFGATLLLDPIDVCLTGTI